MPNRNYERGRAYEYKAKQQLEAEGYTVIRAAGSHGRWDLLAFHGDEKVRCVQIKRTKAPGGVKALLSRFTPEVSDKFVDELWVWYRGSWYTSVGDPQVAKQPRTIQPLDPVQENND